MFDFKEKLFKNIPREDLNGYCFMLGTKMWVGTTSLLKNTWNIIVVSDWRSTIACSFC